MLDLFLKALIWSQQKPAVVAIGLTAHALGRAFDNAAHFQIGARNSYNVSIFEWCPIAFQLSKTYS